MTDTPLRERIARWCEQDKGREDEDAIDLLVEAAERLERLDTLDQLHAHACAALHRYHAKYPDAFLLGANIFDEIVKDAERLRAENRRLRGERDRALAERDKLARSLVREIVATAPPESEPAPSEPALPPDAMAGLAELHIALWEHHGCPSSVLYGDDGELQCQRCLIDFRRTPISEIRAALRHRPQPAPSEPEARGLRYERAFLDDVIELLKECEPCIPDGYTVHETHRARCIRSEIESVTQRAFELLAARHPGPQPEALPYTGRDEHPEMYDGPCGCDTCMSYGAQDGDPQEGA